MCAEIGERYEYDDGNICAAEDVFYTSCPTENLVGSCTLAVSDDFTYGGTVYFYNGSHTAESASAQCDTLGGSFE